MRGCRSRGTISRTSNRFILFVSFPPPDGARGAGRHRVEDRLVGRHRPVRRGGERPRRHLVADLAADAQRRVDVDAAGPAGAHASSALRSARGSRRSSRRTPRTVNVPAPAIRALSSPGSTCTTSPAATVWRPALPHLSLAVEDREHGLGLVALRRDERLAGAQAQQHHRHAAAHAHGPRYGPVLREPPQLERLDQGHALASPPARPSPAAGSGAARTAASSARSAASWAGPRRRSITAWRGSTVWAITRRSAGWRSGVKPCLTRTSRQRPSAARRSDTRV